MPRKILRRIMPDDKTMREHPHLKKFGERLADPKLWHLNRRSVAGGVAAGLFAGFLPMFGQMLIAATLAIFFRVNLPVAVLSTWFSNPLTYIPVFLFAYKLGALLLQIPVDQHSFDMSLSWQEWTHEILLIWQPLLLGCLIFGLVAALVAMAIVHLMWRLVIIRRWLKRRDNS